MDAREMIWSYRTGDVDSGLSAAVGRDMENPKTEIGRIVAEDRHYGRWLLGEPNRTSTRREVATTILVHCSLWGGLFIGCSFSWQRYIVLILASYEVALAILSQRLPRGTAFEGVVGFVYGSFLGVLISDAANVVLADWLEVIPFVVGAVGLYTGLARGFGLKRRLAFGEIFWDEIGAQILFAYIGLIPLVLALLASGQYLGNTTAVGALSFRIGTFLLGLGGLVAGLAPRRVTMGIRDVFAVTGEAMFGAAFVICSGWYGAYIFSQVLFPQVGWLDQLFRLNTFVDLYVYVGGAWIWLDVCRGVSSTRQTWERTILPRYEAVGTFLAQLILIYLVVRMAVELGVGKETLRSGPTWMNFLLIGSSLLMAWRFRNAFRHWSKLPMLFPTRGVASKGEARLPGPLFAFRLGTESVRDVVIWVVPFVRSIARAFYTSMEEVQASFLSGY